MGCQSIAGLPPALNSPVPIYTPGWREALCELCVLPKNTTQFPRPGLKPGPLDPETRALTMRPPRLPPNERNRVKNPNWQEADQLASYKAWSEIWTRGYRETNPSSGRVEALNPGPPDYSTSALNHRPRCLTGCEIQVKDKMEGGGGTFISISYRHDYIIFSILKCSVWQSLVC